MVDGRGGERENERRMEMWSCGFTDAEEKTNSKVIGLMTDIGASYV